MPETRDEVRDDPNAPARRDDHKGEGATRGTSRMEAFADGVFAIAFTLPVVEIVLPEVERPGATLAADLIHLWPSYLGYLLASAVIGLYWVHHHFSGAIYRTTGHWFLVATVIFLGAIGFIAFPSRVLAEHLADAAAREAGAVFWVISATVLAWTWLLKWTVGWKRGQVDSRLETDYVAALNRRYWWFVLLNTAAIALVFLHWPSGLALSLLLTFSLVLPPRTPRYHTEAPIVEGES
ncbi:TMEM175 family protein [uncultured Sphingomonas sp.]|uniref:TMEM175 family protein n=1 Tax=uncultured Sphingomonas sp. TaxID=158754 RepID=UPI0025D58099|nr:TMEM175 family protein [uncultured Sphingomonas sp.]